MRAAVLLLVAFLAVAVYSQTCPRCTPLCQNGDGTQKFCGDDGCGGSCGSCPFGQECCRGSCACAPNCNGRVCGDDGCGGNSCGTCSSTQTCSNGVCLGTAQAECAGRVCGSNRAGGNCGSCPAGQRCRAGACECYYDCNDRNCGTAPQDAGTNTGLCPQRSCGTCPSGFTCGTSGRCSQSTPCNVLISVVDCDTRAALTVTASVSITWSASVSYSGSVSVSAGGVGNWTTPGIGAFTFTTSASGYVDTTETQTTTATTTALTVCVRTGSVQIDVRDRATNSSIRVSTGVQYSGQGSGNFQWNGLMSFTHKGYGNYNFVATPSSSYGVGNLQTTITASTTIVIIYVDTNAVQIDVRDRATNVSIGGITTNIQYSGQGSGQFTWVGLMGLTHQGFGNYNFVATPSSAYGQGNTQTTISASTTLVIIYVDSNPVQIDVREQGSSVSVNFAVAITYTGQGSGSISWTSLYTWRHQGYGSYTFTATASAANYKVTTQTETVSAATTLIIIYLVKDSFCGDGICNGAEKYSTCTRDCAAVLLEMENADGSGPVTNTTVYYYSQDPRTANAQTGPNEKGIPADKTRTASSGSNIVQEDTYTLNSIVYVKATATNFINFFWAANTSDPLSTASGIWRLRVHLSGNLQSTNKNYRFVNTWKPIDATPTPYAPTDLNLHVFHPSGACDVNNPKLVDKSTGQEIGNSVADSKQSGGPATVDISPGAAALVAVWNTKPPRDFIVAPSQTGRYLKDSGSYVVIYGKTSNAALGKQLGEVVLIEYLKANPSQQSNTSADLWYIADVTVNNPGVDQPTIAPRNTLDVAQITGSNDMIFDCRAYSYCNAFRVPYSDSSK